MSIFWKAGNIKGESSDSEHKDWMDVDTVRWGAKRNITSRASTQGDRESSNAITRDLKITKYMDCATPRLFIDSCCSKGQEMVIHLTKAGSGGGADLYMEYILHHAIISEYDVICDANDTSRPLEYITISFTGVETKYIPYDEDGNPLAPIAVGFDTATNMKR